MLLGIALHASISFIPSANGVWPAQDTQAHDAFGWFMAAIHGFRMPLFFLVSGFFTAMLWRKRGLKDLLVHRLRRLALPLLLGLFTIVPAIWIMTIAVGVLAGNPLINTKNADSDIWSAVISGDADAVEQHLEEGVDIDSHDPAYGYTPLLLAASTGHIEMAEMLVERGADVSAGDKRGDTPLHAALFLGRADIVRFLIDNGGNVYHRNNNGARPIDHLAMDWKTTVFFAGILQIELDEDQWTNGKHKIAQMIDNDTEDRPIPIDVDRSEAKPMAHELTETFGGLLLFVFLFPFFHHLWFLWFLCWLVAAFAVCAAIADKVRWQGPPQWLVLSPARFLWLLPLTLLPQSIMGLIIPTFGPDTSPGILPLPHVLFFYAIFFAYGALYFDCDDSADRVGKWWPLTLPIGLLVIFPVGYEFTIGSLGLRGDLTAPELWRPISVALQVIYAWMMTFALMGFFRTIISRESKTLRYISDSSYWLYLAHLPLIILAQFLVRNAQVPALLKFTLICLVVSALLLISYQLMIRYTWIGTMLNGPRTRPSKKALPTS
jgi:peptidoglycan/LPS O-acetylase OafA/YrhL